MGTTASQWCESSRQDSDLEGEHPQFALSAAIKNVLKTTWKLENACGKTPSLPSLGNLAQSVQAPETIEFIFAKSLYKMIAGVQVTQVPSTAPFSTGESLHFQKRFG